MRRSVFGILVAAALVGAVPLLARGDETATSYHGLDLVERVFQMVREDYVEPVKSEKLAEDGIDGMLSALDPHSTYLDPAAYRALEAPGAAKQAGVGLEVTRKDGIVEVVAPIDGTSAAEAKLMPEDRILRIDDEPLGELLLDEVVAKLHGTAGTKVKLTIERGNAKPFDVTLERAALTAPAVRSLLYGAVGYIRVARFSEDAEAGVRQAIDALRGQASGGALKGIVLDLRNNPRGRLDQAVAVAGDFVGKAVVVSTRGRRAEDNRSLRGSGRDLVPGVPVIVLINRGSAVEAEIVAGALRDDRRAVLMGTRTFGSGTVQSIIPIPGQGALKLTTARYYTPQGHEIEGAGIAPDITVEPAKLEYLPELHSVYEKDLPNALKNPDGTSASAKPAAPGAKLPADDYQLYRAIDLLRGLAVVHSAGM